MRHHIGLYQGLQGLLDVCPNLDDYNSFDHASRDSILTNGIVL